MLRKNKYANVVINKGALILEHLQRRSTWKWLITMPRVILLCRCIMGKTHLERLPSFLPSFSSIRVRGKRLKIAVIVEKTFKFVIFHSIWGFEAGCKFVESLWHLGISLKTSSVRHTPMRIGNQNDSDYCRMNRACCFTPAESDSSWLARSRNICLKVPAAWKSVKL